MEDFNSKYTGAEVENLLDQVASGNVGGGTTPDLSQYATKQELESKVDKVEGKQLSTEDFTTALKQRLEGLSNYDDSEISEAVNQLRENFDTLVSGDSTTAIKTFNEIIAFLSGIEDSENLDSIIASIEQQIAGKMDKVTLSAVATSGSYNDLTDKPTIPAAVTESTVSGWGFTKNTGTYSKPSTGIPKTDLATDVQTSLSKANSALQSEQYKGTVTSVKINGTVETPDASGVVDLGIIEGGGSSSGSSAYPEVSHGTADTTFTLTPNTFHIWDEVSSLTLTLGAETSGVANEYLFQFTSGSEPTTLSLPDDIKWTCGETPTIEANKIYQISILKGLGSVLEWDNSPALIENKVTVSISETKYLISLQYAAASDIVVKVRTGDGPISVNILSGEISKTANPLGPMVDSEVYIESITPEIDNNYYYVW